MTDTIAPPPPPTASGCFGKGCLILGGLLVFFLIALAAGTLWGFHYLRRYTTTRPVQVQAVEFAPPAESAKPTPTPEALSPPPASSLSSDEVKQLERDWKAFNKAGRQGEAVSIELTATDINALIDNSEARGQVAVTIDHNIGRLRFSVPLEHIFMMDGRYVNGEATVEASPDGDPAKARISNIVLSGQPVPDSVLDQGVFGWPSIHTFVTNWLRKQKIATFRIENNKVVGETSGSR